MVTGLLILVIVLYGGFTSSGFVHEFGHLGMARLIGVTVLDFPVDECFSFRCHVDVVAPALEWQRTFLRYSGGSVAATAWIILYILTRRLHTHNFFWRIASPIFLGLFFGESANSLLEGGFPLLYNADTVTNASLSLGLLLLAFGAGVGIHFIARRHSGAN